MRTDPALGKRLLLAALLAALWIASSATGLAREATLEASMAGLRATGAESVRRFDLEHFLVGSQPYHVSFGCTPVGISLCLILLLAFSRLAPRPFLAAALLSTALAGPLMAANTVFSVHLHQSGVPWFWAHYPTSLAVYALLLWGAWRAARRSIPSAA